MRSPRGEDASASDDGATSEEEEEEDDDVCGSSTSTIRSSADVSSSTSSSLARTTTTTASRRGRAIRGAPPRCDGAARRRVGSGDARAARHLAAMSCDDDDELAPAPAEL
eukprot:31566-Pelagococcus_subviridis.AAC.18